METETEQGETIRVKVETEEEEEAESRSKAQIREEQMGVLPSGNRTKMIVFSRDELIGDKPIAHLMTLYTAPTTRVLFKLSGSLSLVIPQGNGEFGWIYVVLMRVDAATMITAPTSTAIQTNLLTMLTTLKTGMDAKGSIKSVVSTAIPPRDILVDELIATQITPNQQITIPHPFTRRLKYWLNPGERILMLAAYQRASQETWNSFFGTTEQTYPGLTVYANLGFSVRR